MVQPRAIFLDMLFSMSHNNRIRHGQADTRSPAATRQPQRFRAAWVSGLLLVLLWGCAAQPDSGRSTSVRPPPGQVEPVPLEPEDSLYSAQLLQAEDLLAGGQLLPAASILRGLDDSKLSPNELAWSAALQAEVYYLQGDTAAALPLLRQARLQSAQINPARKTALEDWLLLLVAATDGPLASAKLADQFLVLEEEPVRRDVLFTRVWQDLQRVSVAALQSELENSQSPQWRGWLELALLAADTMDAPDAHATQLALWQERRPDHVAAASLPGGLAALLEAYETAPQRMALLLPLSRGPSEQARAVLEGFLAAQYRARQRGWPAQELMIVDTSDYGDFAEAYAAAVRAGAELVIGPLPPETGRNWQAGVEFSVPLLALNWLDATALPYPPPVQLHVSAEDEARQLARLAFNSGARRALIVRPAGDWGDQVSQSLANAWQDLDGEIQSVAIYSGQEDYSSSLKGALKLADSEARATRTRRLLAEPTEFNPRRRQDLDVVFLLSEQPQQARSIKPLLAFHYAGDLPVYSTSQIFSGRRDPQRDRDLNGINIVEMPWLLTNDDPVYAAVLAGGADEEMADMHALGADAFLLNWRLTQFRSGPDVMVRGHTGLLSMDDIGRVHRELVPAGIRDGVPVASRD